MTESAEKLTDSAIPATLLQQLQTYAYKSQHDNGEQDVIRKPNNAWNYRGQRKRLSHLVKHPPSQNNEMGTRDISFIHDVQHYANNSEISESGETLLPQNYHLVRSKQVAGLDTRPSPHTTQLCDVDKQLRVFPSLQPNRRFEAIQLNRTFDAMIAELGIMAEEQGPSQVHNILQMVKKEQDIYDAIFYELIRQVTIECRERGELLSKLRRHYADLLARMPRQVNSLHSELIAQRALDGNLTKELLNFKKKTQELTKELSSVKKHDLAITNEAEKSKEELRFALMEASKNCSVLQEYHILYELQRTRLEKQIKSLTFERDIWNSTAYSLAIKLIEENDLTLARRLYVSERAWSKVANHFTVFLTERDSSDLVLLQLEVENWRDLAVKLDKKQSQICQIMKISASNIEEKFRDWVKILTDKFIYQDFAGSRRMNIPDSRIVDDIIDDCQVLKKDIEKFLSLFESSESLSCHALLTKMDERVENWTDKAIELYSRHRTMEGNRFPQHDVMASLNEKVHKLQHQLQLITTGENSINGRASGIKSGLTAWKQKLMERIFEMDESEWLKLVDLFFEYAKTMEDVQKFIGSINGLEDPTMKDIPLLETVTNVTAWLRSTLDGIEAEDGKLSGMVSIMKNDLLTWMSSSLLHLVPDKSNNKLLRDITNPSRVTAHELINDQPHLCQRCIDLTEYIAKCTREIVTEQVAMTQNNLENTLLDQLINFQAESLEWEKAAEFLVEALQKVSQAEIKQIAQTLDQSGKINTIEYNLDEPAGTFAESLYVIGSNENITSRNVERPNEGDITDPMTETSKQALQTLSTVERLQIELLDTEDRAVNAERKVDDLEEKIRELERAMARGETLPEKKSEVKVVKEVKIAPPLAPPTPSLEPTSSSIDPSPSNQRLNSSRTSSGKNRRKTNKKGK